MPAVWQELFIELMAEPASQRGPDYLDEGPRSTDWLAKGVIKQHRTLGTYINLLLRIGFSLRHLEEWSPTDAQIAARPALAEERHRPMFFLLSGFLGWLRWELSTRKHSTASRIAICSTESARVS